MMKNYRNNALTFALMIIVALSALAGTVAVTHYLSDSAKVAAEPTGG
jgi:Flp pilus assembly protein TadG